MDWVCYFIKSDRGFTYVGITNNLKRRLRQHNGEIKGGAKYTSGKGPWRLVCHVGQFPTVRAVKQFEWRMHHPDGRRKRRGGGGIVWRMKCLQRILALNKWTSTAPCKDCLALRLDWFDETCRPADFILPNHVTEQIHTSVAPAK